MIAINTGGDMTTCLLTDDVAMEAPPERADVGRSLKEALEGNGFSVLGMFAVNAPISEGELLLQDSSDKELMCVVISRPGGHANATVHGASGPTRAREPRKGLLQRGGLVIDRDDRSVSVGGNRLKLTITEYCLLQMIAEPMGRLVRQREILRKIWGRIDSDACACLRVCIWSLRKKLRRFAVVDLIITEPGLGYRLATDLA